jgi:hypothetical protein
MKLYERDYQVLSKKEILLIERTEKKLSKGNIGLKTLLNISRDYYRLTSFFPNNNLDIDRLKDKDNLKLAIKDFRKMLNKKLSNERSILNFIREEEAYFLIGSILENYDFGHHAAFLFPEFKLGTEYIADYLLIGKNSGGYEFVFIELESIRQGITTKDGSIGKAINKGVKQVEDWSTWLQSNFSTLRSIFKKSKYDQADLSEEFYDYESTRIHFVVVAGRRKDFNKRTYRVRRTKKKENNILILHYDNLIDYAESKIGNPFANY